MSEFSQETHHFAKRFGNIPYQVCLHCGLVALRNDFTRFAIVHGCNYKDHPGYAAAHARSGIDPLKRRNA